MSCYSKAYIKYYATFADYKTVYLNNKSYLVGQLSRPFSYFDIINVCFARNGNYFPQPKDMDELVAIINATGIDSPFFLNIDSDRYPQGASIRWPSGALLDRSLYNGTFNQTTFAQPQVLMATPAFPLPVVTVQSLDDYGMTPIYNNSLVCVWNDFNSHVGE